MFESAFIEGQHHLRIVAFMFWFCTSKCCPAYSSWRSGGDGEMAESSHPRMFLLSASSTARMS